MEFYNVFEEWQNASEQLLSGVNQDARIVVKMGGLNEKSGDVLNLCYLYPLAYALYSQGKISAAKKLEVNISFGNGYDARLEEEQLRRIRMFLGMQYAKEYIELKVASKNAFPSAATRLTEDHAFPELSSAGRLFPLYEATAEMNGSPLESHYRLFKMTFPELQDRPESSRFPFLKIVQAMHRFIQDEKRYVGSTVHNIDGASKAILAKQLESEVERWSHEISVLALAIWLMLLRDLIEDKQILSLAEKGNPAIDENKLTKSRMDAITYGEAMYQLIENACLHSNGKRAWFGFRMHKVSKDSSFNAHVIDRYTHCFPPERSKGFDEGVSRLFEFFVVDSAFRQGGMCGHFNDVIFQQIKDRAYESVKKINPAFKCPDNRLSPEASTQEWKDAEKEVKKQDPSQRFYIGHITELFHLEPEVTDTECYIADLSEHYGLRLLRKIVSINKGYIQGSSPDGASKTQYYYNENNNCINPEENTASYVTIWSVILPLQYRWEDYSQDVADGFKVEVPDNPTEQARERYILLKADAFQTVEAFFSGAGRNKPQDVEAYYDLLADALKNQDLDKSVIILEAGDTLYDLEILVKALFRQLARLLHNKEKKQLRIAVILPNLNRAHEFIRLFSILYFKEKLPIMDSVQIALCAKSNSDEEPIYIACMLAGEYLSTTNSIARLFSYHYPEHTFCSQPILSYLIPETNHAARSDIELFPFDLFLSRDMLSSGGAGRCGVSLSNNLFLDRIKRLLCTDIQEASYGCKISDVHVRLGSKIHLDRFYEAELLFHDTGNIARFAYMLVRDLLFGSNKLMQNESVLLLGYEKFSAPLMMQVERWLKAPSIFPSVSTAIIHDFDEQKKEVHFHPLFQANGHEITGTTQVVSVLPVGTGLTTIYKLHNTAKREYPALNSAEFRRNYCIVLIGDGNDESALSTVTQRYWKNIQPSEHLVTVQPECYDGISAPVRYLIRANANWYPTDDCPKCKDDRKPLPILDIKHAETIPAGIFLLRKSRRGKFADLVSNPSENQSHFSALLNHVQYAHICNGNNHFQFYIDFQRMFANHADGIEKYFETVTVDQNAFHVLVSPLQITNSSIADVVIRKVFRGCSRFLYFNIADAYREEVRTKFCHITQDYLTLRQYNDKAKLHIHYVDNSIINGALIGRARLLMRMLINQAGLEDEDAILFDHIFLLVNRSSFDTINSFVRFPQRQLHAYIHLAVPSYNTENDSCPACHLVEKYSLLRKRSSSKMLDLEFGRLINKHTKRTASEYKDTLRNDILHSPAYFGWLRQWLHVNVINGRIYSIITATEIDEGAQTIEDVRIASELKAKIDDYLSPLFSPENENIIDHQGILQKLSEVTVSDILQICDKNTIDEDAVVELVNRHIVGQRDYMRLYSMQVAYERLEQLEPKSTTETYEAYYNEILKLIDEKLFSLERSSTTKGVNRQFNFVYNAEWLISFIKVLSRAQLSSYYAYRCAIASIISTIITLFSAPKKQFLERCKKLRSDNPKWGRILGTLSCALGYARSAADPANDNEIYPLICYQLNITLFHRICDLQVRWVIAANSVHSYVKLYLNCVERLFTPGNAALQINFPTMQSAILRYMKALKTAAMSSEDDIPCLELVKISQELFKINTESDDENDMLNRIARFIVVENGRMLYSGMCDLEKKILAANFDTNLSDYRPSENFQSVMNSLNDKVIESIRICYGGNNQTYHDRYLLYQNYLSNFCRFWHMANQKSPLEELGGGGGIAQVSYLLQYFLRLRALETLQHGMNQINDIPYAYEELCRAICGLSNFDMCYIAFRGEGKLPEIVAQSGYYVPYMGNQKILTAIEIDKMLIKFGEDDRERFSAYLRPENSAQKAEGDEAFALPCILNYQHEKRQALIFELSVHDNRHSNDSFYLILQKEEQPRKLSANETLTIARNILFMRFTLLEVLTRDYALLANFRHDCTYIRPLNKEKGYPTPRLLHLSDLHVDQKNVEELIKKFKAKMKDYPKKNPIDLLVITGDVADGKNANASIMEERYRCVEKLLNEIVICLWEDEMNYLSHDWRRRVVITTGNHDYASMNQYNAQFDRRTLVAGTPVKDETGVMSKFSYFIHFLIRYLDPPISELLNHDLNEVRNYRYLNLKMLCLNCSSLATASRTNKLGVNKSIVLSLTQRAIWTEKDGVVNTESIPIAKNEPYRVCAAHYSPQYELSYFLDNYSVLPGWEWSTGDKKPPTNTLLEQFRELILKEYGYRAGFIEKTTDNEKQLKIEEQKFLAQYHSMMGAIEALQKGKACPQDEFQQFYNWMIKMAPPYDFPEEKYPLLKHLERFSNWLESEKQDNQDETIARFLMEACEHIVMGKNDVKCYSDLIKEIHKAHPFDVILAGHIHAYSKEEMLEGNKHHVTVLVSDKLYQPICGGQINGYIIEFLPPIATPKYKHKRLQMI